MAAVMALAALAAACGPTSRVDRAAAVDVRARVLDPSGAPAAGAGVVLARERGAAELIGGFYLASFTLFTACLADPPPEICRGGLRRTATAGDDGSVAFHLSGTDTQGTFGTASTFSLGVGRPSEGPAATYRFHIQTDQLTLPGLRLWQPDLRLPEPGQAAWDALPAHGYGDGKGYRLLFETPAGGAVWAFESDGTQLRFDARVLEDSQGGAFVVAGRDLDATGTAVHAEYGSSRVAYTGSAGPPPSRRAPCSVSVDGGAAAPLDPCPLTDGDLTDPLGTTTAPSGTATATATATATIDLQSPRPVALVVVRGCACEIESSADGSAWTSFGRLSTPDSSVVPPRPTTARFVRLRTTGSLGSLREVSVWEGQPGAAGAVTGAGGISVSSDGRRPRTSWVVVAALALGLAAGGAVAVSAVRRRTHR